MIVVARGLVPGAVAAATIEGRTAQIGIGLSPVRQPGGIAGGQQGVAQIERDDRIVETVFLTAAEILVVGDGLDREPVMKQGFREVDVKGIPILPFTLVIAVDQLVVEIEDRGIGQRLVIVGNRPQITARERGVGMVDRGDGVPLREAVGVVGLAGRGGKTLGVDEVDVVQAKAAGAVVGR